MRKYVLALLVTTALFALSTVTALADTGGACCYS